MNSFLLKSNQKNFKSIYLILIISLISYFYGFYIREISNGAAHTDLQLHVWLLVKDFKSNFFETLKNYLNYKEATFPFFHITQSKFNPFLQNYLSYSLSNSVLNLGILAIFFYFIIKKKIFKNNLIALVLCSAILLSPWFRSTSFWGTTENFSFFFLIPACYYLGKLFENSNKFENDFALVLFLSLALYSRQQYLFLIFTHIFFLFFYCEKNKIVKSLFFYFAFSIPGLITYYIWGVFNNLGNATSASDYISPDYIFKNIPKITTILFFYTLPIFFLNLKKIINLIFKKKFIIIFFLIFLIEILLFNEIKYSKMGGGFIIKFNYLFLGNKMFFPILVSSFYFALLINFFERKNIKYFALIFFIFLIIGLPDQLYQEWFDPFYLIAYYLLLPNYMLRSLNLDQKFSVFFIYTWELGILLIAIFYYHFYLKFPFFYSF